jgi:predicted RNA-binding Zn-ribbon protein involved in translation (DUF1610 family)
MPKKKEPVTEAVTIKCPHCKEIVDIVEGLISPEPCAGTIPIYIQDGEICLDWANLIVDDMTFSYTCPNCYEEVADWSEDLEDMHKKYKRSLARKKKKEDKNEDNRS